MALELLKYLGKQIFDNNKPIFDSYGVNAIQLKTGKVVVFDGPKDKRYVGISDAVGTGFYISIDPASTFNEERRFVSSTKQHSETVKCKLVVFDFQKKLDAEKIARKMLYTLQQERWETMRERKPSIKLLKGNINYLDIFSEEAKKNAPKGFVGISIEFNLKFLVNLQNCDPCDTYYVSEVC